MRPERRAPGNIAADPGTGKLVLVFADNRNGNHDVKQPETNLDVFMMTSSNGVSWSGPVQVTHGLSDEWFPWVDVDPVTHAIGIVYHGRNIGDTAVYSTYLTLINGTGSSTGRVSDKTSRARQSLWSGPGRTRRTARTAPRFSVTTSTSTSVRTAPPTSAGPTCDAT